MIRTNCLIGRVHGRQLDQLRAEAFRIAQGQKADWWVEHGDKGTRFCFENADAKQAFASICENLAILRPWKSNIPTTQDRNRGTPACGPSHLNSCSAASDRSDPLAVSKRTR